MKLSEHFSLEEMIKTKTGMSNIPDDKAVANLKNICQNWLEDLRYSYGALYGEGKETPILVWCAVWRRKRDTYYYYQRLSLT